MYLQLMINSTQQNATRFPLLRLPAEIRHMVFNHVFQDKHYSIGPGYPMWKRPSLHHDLGLFLVSRQLYRETALLPYKLAVFQLAYYTYRLPVLIHLDGFLRERSKAQIEVMARVECYDSRCMDIPLVMGTGVYWAASLKII
jgi:hypothetical protein